MHGTRLEVSLPLSSILRPIIPGWIVLVKVAFNVPQGGATSVHHRQYLIVSASRTTERSNVIIGAAALCNCGPPDSVALVGGVRCAVKA
eukprot:6490720-Amphidinium_carterae.2